MASFNSTLLREKFVIEDAISDDMSDKSPIIALSNRLTLPFAYDVDDIKEPFVVRAQNMHTALRLGAQMAREFQEDGPLLDRKKPFDWRAAYLSVTKGYEKKWNPHRWVAVYHKGRIVYEEGETERHPFLDIIEQCDARNPGDYEKSIEIAKDAFRQAGKTVNINHDANVALVLSITHKEGKGGVILRGPNHTTTFNFIAKERAGRDVKISQCLTISAAFLEGIQLAFLVGMTNQKIKYELIEKSSEDAIKARDASQKLGRLNGAVAQFENLQDVSYRPDRPNFAVMIDEAELFAKKVLADAVKEKIASGEKQDWVE